MTNELFLILVNVVSIILVIIVYGFKDHQAQTVLLDLSFKYKQLEDELKQQGRQVAKIPAALTEVSSMKGAVAKLDVDVENCQDHLARIREQQLSLRETLLAKRNKVMVEFSEQAKELAQKIKKEKL